MLRLALVQYERKNTVEGGCARIDTTDNFGVTSSAPLEVKQTAAVLCLIYRVSVTH